MPRHLEYIALDELRAHPKNPKLHQLDGISASMERVGFIDAIVIDERTGQLISGHGRVESLVTQARAGGSPPDGIELDEQGRWCAPVQRGWASKDDADAEFALVALNGLVSAGGYDDRKLADIFGPMVEGGNESVLLGSGFEPASVKELLARFATEDRPEPNTDPDDAPPLPPAPLSARGDLYLLGEHRVLCGDSTHDDDVDRLLAGVAPDLVFTDPPYGMSYGSFTDRFEVIAGDDLRGDELQAMLRGALGNAARVRKGRAAVYVCLTWRTYADFLAALAAVGLEPAACIVWDKGSVGLGQADYRPRHEFVFYVEPFDGYAGDHELVLYTPGEWNGDRAQGDVWRFSRDAAVNYVHPTQKPVALVRRAITNSSRHGQLVLDLFGGSGTTLIAAHAEGRRAALMELDGRYVDVICARWEAHTGVVPILESTGEPRSFLSGSAPKGSSVSKRMAAKA